MRIDVESSFHAGKAMELFLDGYNCAQSVFTAFCDLHGMEEMEALRLSSSFGGGMGRMREVCGALSGIFMAAGLLYGYDSPDDKDAKTEHYRTGLSGHDSRKRKGRERCCAGNFWAWRERERTASYRLTGPKPTTSRAPARRWLDW